MTKKSAITTSLLPPVTELGTASSIQRPPRVRVLGNFTSVHEVVRSIGDQIAVPDNEVDNRRGLNRPHEENPYRVKWERAVIRTQAQMARAAWRLLELLRATSNQPPTWFDTSSGTQLPTSKAHDDGLQWLAIVARWEADAIALRQPELTLAYSKVPNERAGLCVGFDRDEVIRFLDINGIGHGLGQPTPIKEEMPFDSSDIRTGNMGKSANLIHAVTHSGKQARLGKQIAKAKKRVVENGDDDRNADAVWRCIKLVLDEDIDYEFLRYDGEHKFKYRYRRTKQEFTQTLKSLREYLDPDKKGKREARKAKQLAKAAQGIPRN